MIAIKYQYSSKFPVGIKLNRLKSNKITRVIEWNHLHHHLNKYSLYPFKFSSAFVITGHFLFSSCSVNAKMSGFSLFIRSINSAFFVIEYIKICIIYWGKLPFTMFSSVKSFFFLKSDRLAPPSCSAGLYHHPQKSMLMSSTRPPEIFIGKIN